MESPQPQMFWGEDLQPTNNVGGRRKARPGGHAQIKNTQYKRDFVEQPPVFEYPVTGGNPGNKRVIFPI